MVFRKKGLYTFYTCGGGKRGDHHRRRTARLALYRDRRSWKQIQLTGMRQYFSWRHSAGEYLRPHNEALRIRQLLHKEQLWTK